MLSSHTRQTAGLYSACARNNTFNTRPRDCDSDINNKGGDVPLLSDLHFIDRRDIVDKQRRVYRRAQRLSCTRTTGPRQHFASKTRGE
jgi:hypothetical protein